MDIELFKKRIQNTILLTDEKKAYYISMAEEYPPEVRKEMVEALLGQEKEFVAAVTVAEQETAKKESARLMSDMEAAHQRDLAEADRLLAEIANM